MIQRLASFFPFAQVTEARLPAQNKNNRVLYYPTWSRGGPDLGTMSGYPDPKLEDAERENPMQVSKTAVSWAGQFMHHVTQSL